MPRFRAVPVSSPAAADLLEAYFAERRATFPSGKGSYRTASPSDVSFTPPAGSFLLVEDDASSDSVPEPGTVGALACGGVRRIDPTPEGLVRYEVKHVFVRPEARGRGLGRLLMAELEEVAAGLGADLVVLDTNESLLAAGALYRATGYREVEPYNDNPNATTWFAKPVAPRAPVS
ncbi:GNAT family N-acetyltransferase [Frigoribacterium sp. ACAM 257]|uniref:GNAT family N-acetyltransferase n=1 Tax=Frigoribacterium sp. ACAM 257 TaxID=2508998 RepID=UPI0011B98033|nr:GNAT family N-acetyltransferase [Frigoribacterium sp. ACAM 257]TWX37379.1 GNAT family N-acetyltransferase [Frigoribacterium sp. ACAM 257]